MDLHVSGEIWYWKGPSPFHFVTVPEDESQMIASVAPMVTYGWGVIPVTVTAGGTTFSTALFPKDGGYLVPLKDAVRRAEGFELGDVVDMTLTIDV